MAVSLLQGKRFFCRDWAFLKLAHCLEQRPVSKTCGALIVGGPGSGKTALCCEIVWPTANHGRQRYLNKRLLAYHFCQAHDNSTLSLSEFVRHLVQQLVRSPLISGYAEKLKDPEVQAALKPEECEKDPDEALKKAVLFPLLELDPPKQCCFVLVDSVDESYMLQAVSDRTSGSRTIAELLANHHHLFPQWLLLVCTARKQSKTVSRMFTGFRKIGLDDLRKSQVVRDVQQYILARLDQEDSLRQHISRETAEMLNQLHIKSNGCFLYLEKVLDGVAESFIILREVREIPGTLNGLYLWLCQRLFNRKQFSKVQPILNAILAARRPLTEDQLYHCVWTSNTVMSREEFQKRIHLLRRVLVVSRDETLLLFHHSFAEWMLDVKHCTQKYLCQAAVGHGMLAMSNTLKAKELTPDEVQGYALHLTKLNTQPPLEHHHLVVWLISSGAPVEECLQFGLPKEPKVLKLLLEAGAQLQTEDGEESSQVSEEVSPTESDNPLADLIGEDGDLNRVDANGRTLLHTLAYEGNVKLVQLLVSRGVDLEATDKNGQTALNLAARHGFTEIVEALLEAGGEPDHADNDGWTALRSAAWGGHTGVVEALLTRGAKVDCADTDQRTALRAAAWGGHEDIVLSLLRNGADVNRTDDEGRTALIAAAYMGHSEIVEHLLDYGAELNHEDADGRTALSVAALCVPANEGYAKVVNILLERGAEVDHQDRDGMTPLLVAAFEGHRDVCELLLEYEADVDHADHNGRTPLWAAASMGHSSVVELLLFWGCYVDSIDNEGRTVLSIAAAQGSAEVVRQLLDRGLDEMHRDNAGWTPLHYASFEGHREVCEALLEAGARVDETDNDGKPPLILAAQEGHLPIVACLMEHGAVVDHRSHDGKTALRVAALEGHKDVVHLLLCEDADVNYKDADGRSTLYILALENRVPMAQFLLESESDVESTDLEGRTPLHVSAWQGHLEMVELLLNAGADVNATDNENRTALQSASWQGHTAIVRLLLERNAMVDHTCNQGATALCIAAQEGHEECVAVLLQYGADPSHSDRCGRNALRVAIKSGHDGVVKLLEEYAAANPGIPLQKQRVGGGGGSSTTSMTSGSTAETKPSSAVLCPPGLVYSPIDSPESTVDKRRSFISIGNNSSSKSSSNFTGSTKSSQKSQVGLQEPTPPPTTCIQTGPQPHHVPNALPVHLSFTQQLQQCTRTKNRPMSKVLSPLSEPQSPIYASPPQSPLSDVPSGRLSPPQQLSSPQNGAPPLLNLLSGGHLELSQPPLPRLPRTSAVVAANPASTAINSPFAIPGQGMDPNKIKGLSPLSFTQDSHMRIILGGRTPDSSKLRRNGIVTNPNVKVTGMSGLRIGLKNGLDSRKQAAGGRSPAPPTTRSNGFPWKKETPL